MQRFILNLRQLDSTASESNSDAQHFSRFSVNFRVPSDFLWNIGESLDHGQLERAEDNGDDDKCVAGEPRDGLEEGYAHQLDLSVAYRGASMGAGPALVLRSVGRASEEDIIRSSAHLRGGLAQEPSTSAH